MEKGPGLLVDRNFHLPPIWLALRPPRRTCICNSRSGSDPCLGPTGSVSLRHKSSGPDIGHQPQWGGFLLCSMPTSELALGRAARRFSSSPLMEGGPCWVAISLQRALSCPFPAWPPSQAQVKFEVQQMLSRPSKLQSSPHHSLCPTCLPHTPSSPVVPGNTLCVFSSTCAYSGVMCGEPSPVTWPKSESSLCFEASRA
jgi:hypothetical protein